MGTLPLQTGRHIFGNNPGAYHSARPHYTGDLYQQLINIFGSFANAIAFEVGAGTGIATKQLLALGLGHLRAIEPNTALAAYLKETVIDTRLYVDESTFEDAALPPAYFNAGFAATSFHWLPQQQALAKVYNALQPGGLWAIWSAHFGAAIETDDNFHQATKHLFKTVAKSPSQGGANLPYVLDAQQRINDLTKAGFTQIQTFTWQWLQPYTTAEIVALYSTFSTIQSMPQDERVDLLTSLAAIADKKFNGLVQRQFITALYTARR